MIRVFLSHNSADKPQVEHIAHELQKAGFSPWLDAWNLSPGDKWQEGLEQGLINSQVCLVFIGKNGRGPWHDAEIYAAVDKNISHKQIRVIPVLLPDAPDNALGELPLFLQGYNAERFTSLDDQKSFRRLCAGIREEAPGPDTDRKKTPNPYRGLDYFDLKHANFFHGREEITGRLLDLLRPKSDYLDESNNRFLAIIGASGSGKSSIARAGLLAALQSGRIEGSESWPQIICTPGKEPLESLAIALNSHQGLKSRWDTHELIEKFKTQPLKLHYLTLELLQGDKQRRLVLLLDQFEEIFTLCESKEDRGALVANILRAAKEETGQLIVVITLRADFYSHCTAYPELSRYFEVQQRLLNPMTEQELRAAIERPARQAGCELEQGLVDVIISDAQQQPGTLPLLQYALMRLWDQSSSKVLRLKDYQAFGGLGGALEQRANELYEEFPTTMQDQCRLIFRRLVQPGEGTTDTRRRSRLEELGDSSETLKVIQTLTDARLLTTQENSGMAFVEVSHEALIREWSQLQEWIEEDRSDLRLQHQITSAAQDWQDHEREDSWLFTGARLAAAVEWVKENAESANELETAFISASKQEEEARQQAETKLLEENAELEKERRIEAEKRGKEQYRALIRSRWTSGVMALLTVAMLVIAGFAYQAENKATVEAQKSEQSKIETEQALVQVESEKEKTEVALKEAEIAKQSAENSAKKARKNELEANYNLAKAFEEKALSSLKNIQNNPQLAKTSILYALDAQTKAIPDTLSVVNTPVISKLTGMGVTGLFTGLRSTPSLNMGVLASVAISPDGTKLATVSKYMKDDIKFWETKTGKLIHTLPGHENGTSSVVFSPNGKLVASAGSFDKSIILWSLETGKVLHVIKDLKYSVRQIRFSPDGKKIASTSPFANIINSNSFTDYRSLFIHEVTTGKLLITIPESDGHFIFSPNGKYIAGGSFSSKKINNLIKVWESDSGKLIRLLEGHSEPLSDLSFHPDGNVLVTASLDKSLRFWDVNTGKQMSKITTKPDTVHQVNFSPDGRDLLLSLDGKAGILVWEIANNGVREVYNTLYGASNFSFDPGGKTLVEFGPAHIDMWDMEKGTHIGLQKEGHWGSIETIAYNPISKEIATGGWDGRVLLWNTVDGGKRYLFDGTINSISKLFYSPDGTQIITLSGISYNGGTYINVWEVMTGNLLKTLKVDLGRYGSIVNYDPQRGVIATTDNNKIKLMSVTTGDIVGEYSGHNKGLTTISFSPDGVITASGGYGNSIHIWRTDSGEALNIMRGHVEQISGIIFSPDGKLLASSSTDSTIRLWNVNTGEQVKILSGYTGNTSSLLFSPDGKTLISSSSDKTIKYWNVSSGELIKATHGPSSTTSMAFSSNGEVLASGSQDGVLHFQRFESQDPDDVLLGHTKWIPVLTFSKDGQTLVSGSADHSVRLWDIKSRSNRKFTGHTDKINDIVFTSDGKFFISSADDKTMRLWQVSSGEQVKLIEQGKRGDTQVTALEFMPGTSKLFIGNGVGNIELHNLDEEAAQKYFRGHDDSISSLAFSPNGDRMVSASLDGTLRVWKPNSETALRVLKEHNGPVTTVAFNSSGSLFASGSNDNTVRIWDSKTLETLRIIKGHTKRVFKVSFSPDGKTLTSSSSDNTVRQWDVETGKLLNILQGGYTHAQHPSKKILASAYGSVIRLWDQTDPIYRLFYDFDPTTTSAALKFIWQLELDGLEYKHVDYPMSLKPEMGYHIAWTDETRKFRSLLDMPESGETKIEQVVRWLDEQKAYRKTPAGLPVTH